ncbi:hypothetical protein GGS21DRAFT_118901 [Xylaria nigripes]|nr:hypothetical protein GGS21DRAFT_118901 [Xylaria nigripes]
MRLRLLLMLLMLLMLLLLLTIGGFGLKFKIRIEFYALFLLNFVVWLVRNWRKKKKIKNNGMRSKRCLYHLLKESLQINDSVIWLWFIGIWMHAASYCFYQL